MTDYGLDFQQDTEFLVFNICRTKTTGADDRYFTTRQKTRLATTACTQGWFGQDNGIAAGNQ